VTGPEDRAVVQCAEHTSEATIFQMRHGLQDSRHHTAGTPDPAAGTNGEHGRHGNTTSTPTCRRCHGY